MIAGKQIGPLADADAVADPNGCVVVDPDQFAQPYVIADLEEPWVLDGDAGLADETLANPGAEGPQNRSLPARRDQSQDSRLEEPGVNQIPRGTPGGVPVARDDRALIEGQVVSSDPALFYAFGGVDAWRLSGTTDINM